MQGGRTRRTLVKKKKESAVKLMPPPPDAFIPWQQHRRRFNRLAKGHNEVTIHGITGVMLPGDQRDDAPWTAQREFNST
eukprot:6567747-Alexandrium_andersonii.AAC.1